MGQICDRAVIMVMAVLLLTGCASQEDVKKRLRESDGYYKEGVSFLSTDQQRAFVAFQKAVQADPNNFDAHYSLGNLYFQRKEYSQAEQEFQTCVELNPHSGEAMNYLGRAMMMQGRTAEAIDVIRKATVLPLYATPDIAYTDLGWLLEKQGDLDGAIQAYQSALKTEPPNIPRSFVYLWLAHLYIKQGDAVKARVALTQAKSLDPDGTVGTEAARLMRQLK